jgi:hypothetical protein
MAATLGILTTSASAAGPASPDELAAYPNYFQLLASTNALLQDDRVQVEGEETPEEEQRAGTELIAPQVYRQIADSLFTTSELGITRPGEIQTVPRYALKLGEARVFAQYRQTVRYEDNVFLTDTEGARRRAGIPDPGKDARKWDVRIEERPGLFADVPFSGGDHHFNIGYEANFVNFMRRHQGTGFVEQFAAANVDLKFQNVRFATGDRYELRYDPIETQFAGVQNGAQATNQLKRGINTAWYQGAIQPEDSKLEFEHDFNYEYSDYKGPGTITRADRDELTAAFLAGYYSETDLRWFIEYDYVTRRQREHFIGDSFFNRYSLGVNGRLGENFRTYTRMGWRHELIEVGEPIGDPHSRDGDIDISSDNQWTIDEYTVLSLKYIRESQFSIQANLQEVDHGEIAVDYTLYQNLQSRVGYYIEKVDPTQGESFTSGGVGIGLKYVMSDQSDFDLDYTYRYRIANEPGSDYNDNVLAASFTFKF